LLLGKACLQVLDLVAQQHELCRVADATAHQLLLARSHSRPVRFSVAVRVQEAELNRLLAGTRHGKSLLRGDHVRVHVQQRLHAFDLVAQLSLSLNQPLIGQQELRRLHSRTTRTWPSLTTSPSLTLTSLTVPARGAVTGISIFIDSRTRSSSSSATCAPGCVVIFQTLPTSSALTSVIVCSDRELCGLRRPWRR